MSTSKKRLSIRLLGGFLVEYNGQVLSDISPRAQSIWLLFRYLLANKGRFVSSDALIDLLWGEDKKIVNPQKALQNLIYRLRKLLPPSDANGQEYILYSHRAYGWNMDAEVYVDAFAFDRLIDELKSLNLSEDAQKGRCQQALSLYTGDFLEDIAVEEWVEGFASYYRRQYFDCVNIYLDLLTHQRQLNEIIDVCTRALQHNIFEEHYHAALIKAMLAQGNRYGALSHYESITALLMKELGVQPSDELISAGKGIYSTNLRMQSDISVVLDDLCSTSKSAITGPLYCDMDVFRQIFHLHMRTAQRSQEPCMLLLLTIMGQNRTLADDEMLEVLTILKRACILSLRKSDVMAQHSNSQILLLLPRASEDHIEQILARIQQQFSLLYSGKNAVLTSQARPIFSGNLKK